MSIQSEFEKRYTELNHLSKVRAEVYFQRDSGSGIYINMNVQRDYEWFLEGFKYGNKKDSIYD